MGSLEESEKYFSTALSEAKVHGISLLAYYAFINLS